MRGVLCAIVVATTSVGTMADDNLGYGVVIGAADNTIGYFATTNGDNVGMATQRSMTLCQDWIRKSRTGPQVTCRVGLRGHHDAWVVVALGGTAVGIAAHRDKSLAETTALQQCRSTWIEGESCSVRLAKPNF